MKTTAIYPNRIEDKKELEQSLDLSEFGNSYTEFYINTQRKDLKEDFLFAKGYERIVYGDHGPYIEFKKKHIQMDLIPKFGNKINLDNLPDKNYKYYYFWLYPLYNYKLKVYLQIKPVHNLPNAPRRKDGKKSNFNRKEGYADYRRGYFYVDPYDFSNIMITKLF
jgi:hypothetical protein